MSLYPGFADAVEFLYPGALRDGRVELRDEGAGAYVKTWNLPGSPLTNAQVDAALAQIPAAQLAANKTAAKAIFDNGVAISRAEKAVITLLVQELNAIRQWITDFKAANSTATTYTLLKTAINGLSNMPARTETQTITAIKSAIDAQT